MNDVVIVLVIVLAATALVGLGVLYWRFRRSLPAQWKRRVRAAAAEQVGILRSAQKEIHNIDRQIGADELRNQFLQRHLFGLAVEELTRFPGIGPVTASRLRDAGLTHIVAVERSRSGAVPGIGPSREKDIRKALRQVYREAESRFDAGACPEAVAFVEERMRREGRLGDQRAKAEESIRGAEAALAFLEERARVARGVTFLGHLFGRAPSGLTAELMEQALTLPQSVGTTAGAPADPLEPVAKVIGTAKATPAPVIGDSKVIAQSPRKEAEIPPVVLDGRSRVDGAPGITLSNANEDSPFARLRVAAGFGLAVAKADGRIAASERKQVRAFLARRYAPTPELTGQLEAILAELEADLPTIGDAIWDVRRAIPAAAWPELYQFAVSVADAAGERNVREVECLARIAEELRVGPGTTNALPVTPEAATVPKTAAPVTEGGVMSESDCRIALEIAPDFPLSIDLIRRQYRLLSDRFEPDKFGTHGPEFVQIASARLDRVERAARQLLTAYNEPLEPPDREASRDLRHNPVLDDFFGA